MLLLVKPPQGFISDYLHLYPDLPPLRQAFVWVLPSPVLGLSTEVRHERFLMEEFATNIEYMVDIVRRNRDQKVVQ